MREICLSGSEGGGSKSIESPYPYQGSVLTFAHIPFLPEIRGFMTRSFWSFSLAANVGLPEYGKVVNTSAGKCGFLFAVWYADTAVHLEMSICHFHGRSSRQGEVNWSH
jgi:hypothetical protein